jgi:hypothetical protein
MRSNHRRLASIGRRFSRGSLPGRMWNRLFPAVYWLRPNGRNLRQMQRITSQVLRERRPYAEFMLHSSELMPGGSPTFRSPESIDQLYDDLEALFSGLGQGFVGQTLQEFEQGFRNRH